MSRFILPFQRVEDANSHPLDGAKLYFFETGTNTPKDTYSDVTLTTPNTNPVIADSQGQFGDIFMQGTYRVRLDDKNDVTQPDYPADNVRSETGATLNIASLKLIEGSSNQRMDLLGYYTAGDGGGGQFYWDSTSTATDNGGTIIQATGITTGRWLRLYSGSIEIKWFGAKGDGVTDDTTSIQTSINYAATNGLPLYMNEGTFIYSQLYLYYDATLNPGYPSAGSGSKVKITGAGKMARRDWNNDTYKGTVLSSSSTTQNAFNVVNGSSNLTGTQISDISFIGATTGRLVNCDYLGSFNNIYDIFIGNDNVSGTAFYVTNVWTSSFVNIDIVGNKNFNNATPVYASGSYGLYYEDINGGNVLWNNITCAFFSDPMVMGKVYNVANTLGENIELLNCQTQYSERGLQIKHGITHSSIKAYWGEHNIEYDLKISDSANNIRIIDGNVVSTNTSGMIGNVVLGDATGTAGIDAIYDIYIENKRFGHCAVAGIRKYDSAINVKVERCTFKNNGGKAILVDATEAAELELDGNNYYPQDAGSAISTGQRVHDGSASAHHRCFKLDYKSPGSLASSLDMSTWRRLPQSLNVNSLGGDITLTLPTTRENIQYMNMQILKLYANNNVIIDAGAGNVLAPAGTQTHTMTTAGDSVMVTAVIEAWEWIVK